MQEADPRSDAESCGSSAQESTKRLGQKALDQARSAAETSKSKLADGATGVAEALRHASEGLRSDEQAELARYTESVAAKIEGAAAALKNHDLGAIVTEVSRFAKRQPALFLGGAFTAGLLAARFLKSSAGASSDRGAVARPVSQTAFDRAPSAAPRSSGLGDDRSDREQLEQVTAPAGFGPAPGGYGPASAPAGAHGGTGSFGAERAGGGPGNLPTGGTERAPTPAPTASDESNVTKNR